MIIDPVGLGRGQEPDSLLAARPSPSVREPLATDGRRDGWRGVAGPSVVSFGWGQARLRALAVDLANGMVDRFRSLPIARSAYLTGRILADMAGSPR
jgi:hypothetical protein